MLPKRGKLFILLLFLVLPAGVVYAGDAPGLISPENNSTTNSSKLEWNQPSYSLYSSNPYKLQVDNNSDFSSPEKNNIYKQTTNYTPELDPGTWYWRVMAKDAEGNWSDWSTSWSFTLSSATPAPSTTPTSSNNSTSITFEISSPPSSINSNQSFSININITGLTPNAKYFLKGAFFKKDSTNYFGFTKVGSDWIKNGTTYSSQYSFTSDSSGTFNTSLEVKPDAEDSGLTSSGSYQFKVGRYNSSGSSLTWSNEHTLNINIVSTPTSSSSTSKTLSPSPTPTASPKTVKTSTISSKNKTTSPHSIPVLTPEPEVAGESIENKTEVKSDKRPALNWGFAAVGLIALTIGGGAFYLVKKDLIPF